MANWTDIANMAARHVGTTTRITSPDDDRPLAKAIRAVWDLQRRAAIRDGSWNCFTERHRLPALTTAPAFGFDYAYKLPAGCLRLLQVTNDPGYDAYQLEAGKILCDAEAPLDIRCLIDNDMVAAWDDGFIEAFALRIAWAVGTAIAGSSFDKSKVWEDYRASLSSAKRVDAMENPPIEREESDWVSSRWAGATWHMRP